MNPAGVYGESHAVAPKEFLLQPHILTIGSFF